LARREPRWPYREPRRGQLEAARQLAKAVERGEVFALNAPTGFGKTAVAVYGLLLSGAERVLYLVRTRNEIAPVLRELRRFGVEEYSFLYSARRMCPLLGGEDMNVEDFWETCRLLRLRGACSYYEALERLDPGLVRDVVAGAASPFSAVAALSAMSYCPFFALKLAAADASFIVATYPYMLRSDIFAGTFEPLDYGDFIVVFDEAHSLLHAQQLLEARLGVRDIDSAIAEAEFYGLPGDIVEALSELRRLAEKAPRIDGMRRLEKNRVEDVLGEPGLWEDASEEVRSKKLREALEQGGSPRIRVSLAKVEAFAHMVFQEHSGVYLYSEQGGARRGLTALPLEPCPVTREPLNATRAAVLLSGTMPPERFIRELLCVEKKLTVYDVELLHGPVYRPETRAVVLALEPSSRYRDRSPYMYSLYARYLLETYRATRRAVLAVYPSYDFMRSVVSALQGLARREPLHMATEDRGTMLDEVVEMLKEIKHLLINAVAGGKLVEGVEFLDDEGRSLVGTVFVAGVPYPQPDDYLEDQLRVLSSRLGPREARRYIYDVEASIKIRQAIGRAQRGPQDHALIVLADMRFAKPGLLSLLRLRPIRRTYSLEEYRETVMVLAEKLGA